MGDYNLRDYKYQQDKSMAQGDVMPDHWEGHGRIAIRESDKIPEHIEDKVIEKLGNILEGREKFPAEKAANSLIDKLSGKL